MSQVVARLLWLVSAVALCAPLGAIARAQDLPDDTTPDGVLAGDPSEQPDMALEGDPAPEEREADTGDEAPADPEAGVQAEEEIADEEPAETPADAAAPAAEPERAIGLRFGGGLGVGSFTFTRPIAAGVQRFLETPFAATELFARVTASPRDTFSIETLLHYQTSVGLALELRPLFGLPEQIPVRTQRVELSIAPALRLTDKGSRLTIALPIGFAYRTFVPELHQYQVPRYNLGGPLLRAEVSVKLSETIALRAGPEAQWIMIVGPSLRHEGACCGGFGLAGQAAIEASVGEHVRVALSYRQAHASVPSSALFQESERFLTARIAGEL